MSMIASLKKKGIALPPMETEEGLTAKEIMNKIRSFHFRLEKSHAEICEYAESYFLELLSNYPKSICDRHMSKTQKLLIALMYFESKPDSKEENPGWKGFSYEELSIIFDVSKATVHDAVKQKEEEAKKLIASVQLREKAKEIALEQLVEEEKQKLKEKKS